MAELPVYPPQLPPPDDGFDAQHVDPILRTPLGSGRNRKERLAGTVPTNLTVTYLFTIPEFQLFEGWYRWILHDGLLAFKGPMKTSLGIQNGLEMEITEMYSSRSKGGQWIVTAPVQILKRQTISELDTQYPDEIIYSGVFDRTMNRHWPKPIR
ncbi:hypothetical protein [Vreelandella populi]|uniref:hypothetical protein n=1 Tax=Vreelandella populi TaxID=2498858 RepID=UPI000F8F0FD4|nr:hypothetical protein [Halomonas populi]RUR51424.1 hypothetical protein ELY40_16630 [Halomonas populi]